MNLYKQYLQVYSEYMDIKEVTKEAAIVQDTATFAEALDAMDNHKTNTLLVVDGDSRLVGEVTMTDMLSAIIPESLNGDQVMNRLSSDDGLRSAIKAALEKPISDFMSVDFTALEMNDNMLSVIANAIANNRSSIPVVDPDNRPVGIVSRRGLKQIIRTFANK